MTEKAKTETGLTDVEVAEAQKKAAADAVAGERERIGAINKALSAEGLADLRAKAIAEDWTVEAAKAAAFDAVGPIHTAEVEKLAADIAKRDEKLAAIATGGDDTAAAAPVDGEGESTANASDDGAAATYQAALDAHVAAGKSKAEAHRLAGNAMPQAHAAWIKANQ